jgi:tRNA (cmo5U34)-methyltransferase
MTDWKFDHQVATTFVQHARQHIPNYDAVIDKSIELCEYFLPQHASIIDVGCATGETLKRLHALGFDNLTGVDSSDAMLSQCDPTIAQYYHSNQFPDNQYDAVLCNWTLHFVKDKTKYLSAMYQRLKSQGFLVLSEKTSTDDLPIHFYHKFKKRQGVSQGDIDAKARSVKNIMHINSVEWYIDNLKSTGFKQIHIIDADWCFTTFLGIK